MTSGGCGHRSAEAAGLLLAAGAGRRMGGPKALLTDDSGTALVASGADHLRSAGLAPVTVVLGAAAQSARPLVPGDADVVVAEDWAAGMGSSLRAGLAHLAAARLAATAVVVTLVDLPDVSGDVIRRVVDEWRAGGARADSLVRATYGGAPGHPVLIGRDHWLPLLDWLEDSPGDEGARGYLAGRNVHHVSCDDLATGRDVDRPEDLP